MTDEVSELVLADNEQQALALTLDGLRSAARYDEYVAFVEDLVVAGIINRRGRWRAGAGCAAAVEPGADRGLPRPLLAVVHGPRQELGAGDGAEDLAPRQRDRAPFLDAYFPKQLREGFADAFVKHPLRREIIATAAVNYVINKAGVRLIFQMLSASRKDLGVVMQTYLDLDRESSAQDLRSKVLSGEMATQKVFEGLLKIEATLAQATRERLDGKSSDAAQTLKKVAATSA